MRFSFSNIVRRWKATTPKFFKRIVVVGSGISIVAVAIHTAMVAAGAMPPDWWVTVYPYLVGAAAGMAAVAKLTKER